METMTPAAGQPATPLDQTHRAQLQRYAVESRDGPSERLATRARSGLALMALILALGAVAAVVVLGIAAVVAALASSAIS